MSAPDLVVWVEARCRECAWTSGPCRSQHGALAACRLCRPPAPGTRRAVGDRPMSAMRAEVDPAAALELVDLVARQLKQLDQERPATEVPLVVGFLAFGLEDIAAHRRLAAFDVELLRDAAWRARRLDLVRAFRTFNPAFGPVHAGCWGPMPGEQRRQAAAQRHELQLALGDRVTRLLPPGW